MHHRLRFWLLLGVFCGLAHSTQAAAPQKKRDRKKPSFTLPVPSTPAAQEKAEKRRRLLTEMNMQRAWMYSAMIPGLGQFYNEQYWRIPIIYAVLAGFGGCAIYYHREYVEYKRKLIRGEHESSAFVNYVNFCRSAQDVFIALTALWYLANVFDAYVGASLKTFDISDDIGLKVQPTVSSTTQNTPAIGLSLTWRF